MNNILGKVARPPCLYEKYCSLELSSEIEFYSLKQHTSILRIISNKPPCSLIPTFSFPTFKKLKENRG